MNWLYTFDDLKNNITENKITLIDVRDKDSFVEGHIPGAANIPEIFTYLSMSTPEGLKHIEEIFIPKFRESGVMNEKPVVFYSDSLSSSYGAASRGYLILSYLGHKSVGVYAGGLNEWLTQNEKLEFGDIDSRSGNFISEINNDIFVTKNDVLKTIEKGTTKLLDDRDEEEWIGVSSSPYGKDYAPRKGRIKGAKWISWHKFLKREKELVYFRTPEEITKLCANENIFPEDEIIIYCFKGSRASNTYLALWSSGFRNIKVYFASWNEWSRDPSLPIEN